MARIRDLPVFPLTPEPVREGVGADAAPVQLHIEPTGPYDGPRIALVTLGCDKNTVDSERMMAALVGHGAQVSSEVQGADVVIVNTCGFIQEAKEQSIEIILEACQLKEQGELKAVVAVGCMVQRYGKEMKEEIPEVDLFMGLTELQGLVPELRTRGLLPDPSEFTPLMEQPLRILSSETPHTSYLKISEGCDHTCASVRFPSCEGCTVPSRWRIWCGKPRGSVPRGSRKSTSSPRTRRGTAGTCAVGRWARTRRFRRIC